MEASENTFIKVGGVKFDTRIDICEIHGKYQSREYKGHWSDCDNCREEKRIKEHEEKIRQQEKERQEWLFKKRLGNALIPERFLDRSFDNYVVTCEKAETALNVCKAYANGFDEVAHKGTSLIFYGAVGTGKTHLAISIANQILKEGKQPVFTSVFKAVRKIKESWRNDSELSESESVQLFVEPDLLILDEVGVQFGSESEKIFIFDIINGRYEARKPTILISNLGMKELDGFVGTRVIDRLREGGGKAILFDWESYRKKA